MKTRRKAQAMDEPSKGDKGMAPKGPSTPRTRSPVKGGRGGDALSMLNMLAEVASVTLHTDPSVTHTPATVKLKTSSCGSRKPSDYEVLTLDQISTMTDNLLLKLFAEFESNEMWRRFTYTCGMLPAACTQFFQSFGSEHKARAEMKAHLQTHLKSLMEVHTSEHSRQNYILESVPARKRRLSDQECPGTTKKPRAPKGPAPPRTPVRTDAPKRKMNATPEKENDNRRKAGVAGKRKKTEDEEEEGPVVEIKEEKVAVDEVKEHKIKKKVETKGRWEGKPRIKKVKVKVPDTSDDLNNNNGGPKDEMKMKVEGEYSPPMQQVVSHDHGYLRVSSHAKPEPKPPQLPTAAGQLPAVGEERGAGAKDGQATLLHQHMNHELQGTIMAQDSGSSTPLPVVGCEVEFNPSQQYKVMRSADLPVVYPAKAAPSSPPQQRVIERDEYKVRKKPKGRAKFIGQSKVEKEMALKLITEIRSQPVMALDTLECKICHPPRLFTAPSTLLSHYRSHAGIRPYECRICEAVFTRQHSLNYHMLIHTNQTRFTCVDCDRKFRHPSHFKEHRRRHTGESPYECSDCLMRFKTRNTYKRHLRTRHGKLLTTQGAIIILSQEEADRIKKVSRTQGRKPRRPRQPLQIISPETAAQMEEEQVWTDFEEGDKEEEEEEYEDEEEVEGRKGSYPEEDSVVVYPSDARTGVFPGPTEGRAGVGTLNIANGKTGLYSRPTTVGLVDASVVEVGEQGGVELKEEQVEEEVITEQVSGEDLQTYRYVFQPPQELNLLPKVNIRSSWNTINIDLKNLEKASENVVTETICESLEDVVFEEGQVICPDQPANGQNKPNSENVSVEEVITISAEEGQNNIRKINSSQETVTVGKPEYFTVKKPIKCYGRPSSGTEANPAILTSQGQVDARPVIAGGRGVYLVEYVQGVDGRLAKVYHANASVVNKTPRITGVVQQVRKVAVSSVPSLPSTSTSVPVVKHAKFVSQIQEAPRIAQPVTAKCTTYVVPKQHSYEQGRNVIDKVVMNKQVVNNVVVNNHIVKNGSVVSVSSEEHNGESGGIQPQPLMVSSVPAQVAQQVLPQKVVAQQVVTGVQGGQAGHGASGKVVANIAVDKADQIVTMGDDILIENIEIIESYSPDSVIIASANGVVENAGHCSKVKVEKVRKAVSVVDTNADLMSEFFQPQKQVEIPVVEEEGGVDARHNVPAITMSSAMMSPPIQI